MAIYYPLNVFLFLIAFHRKVCVNLFNAILHLRATLLKYGINRNQRTHPFVVHSQLCYSNYIFPKFGLLKLLSFKTIKNAKPLSFKTTQSKLFSCSTTASHSKQSFQKPSLILIGGKYILGLVFT